MRFKLSLRKRRHQLWRNLKLSHKKSKSNKRSSKRMLLRSQRSRLTVDTQQLMIASLVTVKSKRERCWRVKRCHMGMVSPL